MATSPNPMMGDNQAAAGTPSNLSPAVIAQLQQDMMAMPLSELQQYAQAHMNDPVYGSTIVSMASYVSNMKKAAQTPMASQNQPSVAQQAVQSIAPQQQVQQPAMQMPQGRAQAPGPAQAPALPEDQGIGRLAASNIENMARGGIASFADGGDSGNNSSDSDSDSDDPAVIGAYDPTTGMVPGMTAEQAISQGLPNALNYGPSMYYAAKGGHVPSYAGNNTDGSLVQSSLTGDIPGFVVPSGSPYLAGVAQQGSPDNNQVPPLVKLYNDYMARRSNPANPMNHPGGIVPPQAAPAASPAGNITTPPTGNASTPTPTPAQPAPATTGIAAAAPAVDPNAPNPYAPKSTGAGTGIGALNVGDPMALAKALGFSNKTLPEYTQDANALLPGNVTADDLNLSKQRQMIRDQIGRDPNFTDDIKKLDDQDAKAADTKNEKQGLALLMAGASMIGPGNWAENIAKGVGVGAKQYGDDLDKLRQAENERLKMRQNLEIAAYANNAGEVKEALGQVDQATARKDKHDDLVASTAASMFNANRSDIAKLGADYMNNITSQANAATAAGATLQASRNSMNAPLYTLYEEGRASDTSPLGVALQRQRNAQQAATLSEKSAGMALNPMNTIDPKTGRPMVNIDTMLADMQRANQVLGGQQKLPSTTPPPVGTVLTHTDGTKWKFNGGDPSQMTSWTKV